MKNLTVVLPCLLTAMMALDACSKSSTGSVASPDAVAYAACSENQMYAYGDSRVVVATRYDHHGRVKTLADRCAEYSRLLAHDCRLDCSLSSPSVQTFCGLHKDRSIVRLSQVKIRECGG